MAVRRWISIPAAKETLRRDVWRKLAEAGASPRLGLYGTIPPFAGAQVAAARLASHAAWRRSSVVMVNPDRAQQPVRAQALAEGKLLYMAVPALSAFAPFVVLEPWRLAPSERTRAAGLGAALRVGRPVHLGAIRPPDLFVVGSVAVSRDGARLGKGRGYSDLGFALAAEAGVLARDCPVASTVDDRQVLASGAIPMTSHDVPVDVIATPSGVFGTGTWLPRPPGIEWSTVDQHLLNATPALRGLLSRRQARGARTR